MLAPAQFERYMPRLGLADNTGQLSWTETPDTVVAIFAPASFMQELRWEGNFLNVARTIVAWLNDQPSGTLVTFGAYTAELELDIAIEATRDKTE